MNVALYLLHRYMAPALTGICVAAAAGANGVAGTVVLMAVALASGYASLPAGGRLLARVGQTEL